MSGKARILAYVCALSFVVAVVAGPAEGRMFPRPVPAASRLCVVDLREASMEVRLAAVTLQGQLNRRVPASIYALHGAADLFWLTQMTRRGYVHAYDTLSPDEFFARYADAVSRVLLYDPAVPASINAATMLAALDGGVVTAPGIALKALETCPKEDLRGRWGSDAEVFRWALDTLWPRMNHRLLAVYHPTATAHVLRDYLVQNRVFTFWVTKPGAPGHEEQRALLCRTLEAAPANIPVLGFWYSGVDEGLNEYTGLGLAGEYGKWTVVSDWCANLSLLAGVRAQCAEAVKAYERRLAHPAAPPGPKRVYVCVDVVESGDAPCYLQNRQYVVWRDPARGTIPINWSMAPAAFELMPSIAEYYYREATPNDRLYLSISGAAYTHPYRSFNGKTKRPESAWRAYLRETARAMRRMHSAEVGLYTDSWKPFDRAACDEITRRFAENLPALRTLVLGMGRDADRTADNGNYVLGQPPVLITHILTRWPVDYASRTREQNVQWLVDELRANTPATRPAFMSIMALSWAYAPSDIAEVFARLDPEYVPLTLPQFTARMLPPQ